MGRASGGQRSAGPTSRSGDRQGPFPPKSAAPKSLASAPRPTEEPQKPSYRRSGTLKRWARGPLPPSSWSAALNARLAALPPSLAPKTSEVGCDMKVTASSSESSLPQLSVAAMGPTAPTPLLAGAAARGLSWTESRCVGPDPGPGNSCCAAAWWRLADASSESALDSEGLVMPERSRQ